VRKRNAETGFRKNGEVSARKHTTQTVVTGAFTYLRA
jgi:hypothetical protein